MGSGDVARAHGLRRTVLTEEDRKPFPCIELAVFLKPQLSSSGGLQIECRVNALLHWLNVCAPEATSMFYRVHGLNIPL